MELVRKTKLLDPNPVIHPRLARGRAEMDMKKMRPEPTTLSAEQSAQVLAYWGRYTKLGHTGWADFYHERTGEFDVRYLPHDIFYAEIDKVLNPPYPAVGLDDKTLYGRLFPGARQPELIVHKTGGAFWSWDGKPMDMESAIALCTGEARVVCKLPVYSCGGFGVQILEPASELARLRHIFETQERVLVQAVIRQHPDMAQFNPSSVNTLRILTYLREGGEVVPVSSVLRMGSAGAQVDNVSFGGCACGVGDDGCLRPRGYSKAGMPLSAHPGSGVAFAGKRIPAYADAVAMVKAQHRMLPQFALLAWDVAVDEHAQPVLVELNIGNASIDFMQLCNGPLFGPLTEEILERVYREGLTE